MKIFQKWKLIKSLNFTEALTRLGGGKKEEKKEETGAHFSTARINRMICSSNDDNISFRGL